VLARGTYDAFKVKSAHHGPINFKAKSKGPIDIVVRRHDYLKHSSTGWHAHPGPVFITVTQGQLTFYEADDPTCTPDVVSAGEGYVDSGHGHIGRNETDEPARVLMFSTVVHPTATVYPDSDKVGVWVGDPEVDMTVRRSAKVGYYEDEPGVDGGDAGS